MATKKSMTKPSAGRSHDEWLREQLKDPGFAAEYLTAAAEDPEPAVYLAALRQVAESRGIADIAARAGLPRESVYRALSPKGNPRWRTLAAILRATGLKLAVTRPAA
jgi:probable addiction module antidote protein